MHCSVICMPFSNVYSLELITVAIERDSAVQEDFKSTDVLCGSLCRSHTPVVELMVAALYKKQIMLSRIYNPVE